MVGSSRIHENSDWSCTFFPIKTTLGIHFNSSHCSHSKTIVGYFQVEGNNISEDFQNLKLAGRIVGPEISELVFYENKLHKH